METTPPLKLISKLKYKMPYFLYTFRPQITDQDLFETFLDIFLPFLKEFPKYSYSIEEDNTLNKHIHIMYECKADCNNKALPQKLNRNLFKSFKDCLKNKLTNVENGMDDRKVKDTTEDFLKVLGYVNKETNCVRRKSIGFTNEQILEAVSYHYATAAIEKSKPKSDIKVMTSKNIHIHIKDYCQSNNLDPGNPIVKLKMTKDCYAFSQVSKVPETFKEIEIQMYPDRFPEDKYDNLDYVTMDQKYQNAEQKIVEQKILIDRLISHFKIQVHQANFDPHHITIDNVRV